MRIRNGDSSRSIILRNYHFGWNSSSMSMYVYCFCSACDEKILWSFARKWIRNFNYPKIVHTLINQQHVSLYLTFIIPKCIHKSPINEIAKVYISSQNHIKHHDFVTKQADPDLAIYLESIRIFYIHKVLYFTQFIFSISKVLSSSLLPSIGSNLEENKLFLTYRRQSKEKCSYSLRRTRVDRYNDVSDDLI